MGIDDFAIRKGHTYNAGLHDLRGGTFLDVIPGRRLEEMRTYYEETPRWTDLHLWQSLWIWKRITLPYLTFIKEIYPSTLQTANRFQANRYVPRPSKSLENRFRKALLPVHVNI
ncbi:transposase [Paenibacillus sp. DS2015]|uniref:transposase n=1 Tax=Paenibacillus sp. DS2015 TaxID=3373917 RepID=UPI003D24A691